ncbi:dna topoisomerase i [Holotrichia oblita]|uniref:Dna topoisomerase i n=1 Tax=Holotrichia oblita TaxID=644536 RepID=A0ACB9TCB9_HOLOL|nr:dna topoisomerase i [Holotrichia oblita]
MYGVKNSSDVNEVLTFQSKNIDENFDKKFKNFDSSSLPPCKVELQQHLFRVRYVTKLWRNAHLRHTTSLSPVASGWTINDNKYDFVWFVGEQLPYQVADIIIQRKKKKAEIKSEPVTEGSPKKRKKKDEEEQEVWKCWEEENRADEVKCVFLEHKGPVFAPAYDPSPEKIKFYYNGHKMKLLQDAEEVAGFYTKMLDHDYTTKDTFNTNIFKDWRKVMTDK